MQDADPDALLDAYVKGRLDRRQFFKHLAALGLSASAAASLLAACGGGGLRSGAVDGKQQYGPDGRLVGVATTATGTPVRGGILREGYNRDVSRVDPVNTVWNDASLWPVTHETLLTQNPSNKFIPVMAESWEISSDGLQWTFKIRDGLNFQGGAPCDAAACAAAMEFFRDPKTGTNAGFWTPVKSISAESGNVVKVAMAHPYADFPYVLNNGYSAIFNPPTRQKLGDSYGVKATDGTGPFKLTEFVPGSHCTVARWDGYPDPVTPLFTNPGQPYLDGIRWDVLLEPATRAQELESGQVDAILDPAPQDVDRLKGNSEFTVIQFQEPAIYLLGLNFKETKLGFNDAQVRRPSCTRLTASRYHNHLLWTGRAGVHDCELGVAFLQPERGSIWKLQP